jgi:hypothetical protein
MGSLFNTEQEQSRGIMNSQKSVNSLINTSINNTSQKSVQKSAQVFAEPQVFVQPQPQMSAQNQTQASKQRYRQDQSFLYLGTEEERRRLLRGSEKKKTRGTLRTVQLYGVQIRRNRKYVPVASGLTKGQAIAFEQKILLQNIARTGRLVPQGKKEMFTSEDEDTFINQQLFRGYQQRRGKQIQLPFGTIIQRSSANLQSQSERAMLVEAKKTKRMMRGII